MTKANQEQDLVLFSFLVRYGISSEKQDNENSREKWTRLKYYIII
jgi:hypothetical protein